ncbi:MAG: glycosyltransferase family 39 protein [Actinomycetota bacterium]|nr:glycosyltransferase family 39 protein [Actinomycetota bacterium]
MVLPAAAEGRAGTTDGSDLQSSRWARPALLALLALTGLLYLWGLSASGWANSFYAAAAQAGSASWKAFFFGSLDSANSITIDKTPLALWPMDLSVRLFGLSSWSILVPQALEGVAAVGVLYASVRRTTRSAGAGLVAGAVFALTPVAVLMFRYNNPDALLTLLLVAAGAATLRAVDAPTTTTRAVRWLALAGALVGLAFLTKMLQAFLVLPAFGLVYLVAARSGLGRRVAHLLVAFVSMVAAGGWWVLIVQLWPAASRPYIGGSQHNSVLELAFGYNGFGRLTGNETGSVGGSLGGSGRWGKTGFLRMLDPEIGGQVGWLLPTALVLLAVGLFLSRRDARSDPVRAAHLLWGGSLLVTAATFSLMAGIFHPYYTVVLAPAVAAVVGVGSWQLWIRRDSRVAALTMAATLVLTTLCVVTLLARTPSYHPWLRTLVLVCGLGTALLLAGVRHLPARLRLVLVATALVTGLAAPTAYDLTTAAKANAGAIPLAGPVTHSMFFAAAADAAATGKRAHRHLRPWLLSVMHAMGNETSVPRTALPITRLLRSGAARYAWAAAVVRADAAASLQLASRVPVMAIGGYNGTDPSPTLAQFRTAVAQDRIHWFVGSPLVGQRRSAHQILRVAALRREGHPAFLGPGGLASGGSQIALRITAWVMSHFRARAVDGLTMYDLAVDPRLRSHPSTVATDFR